MRFTKMSKTLVLGGALALSLYGCKDDKTTNNTTDSGTDAGHDSGFDAGHDAGPPPPPALLRIAHLATGSGLGAGGLLHLCAYDEADGTRLLVTSDALATGDFTMATVGVPLAPGSISVHFPIPESVTGALGTRAVEVWRASDLNLTFSGLPLCNPIGVAQPLAAVTLGGAGPNDINLVGGEAITVTIVGGDGPELQSDGATPCKDGVGANVDCPAVSIVTLDDELFTTATTEAHVRIVNADGRFTAPGVCYDTVDGMAPAYTAVTASLATYVGLAKPAYANITALGALDIGGGTFLDQFITLHPLAGPMATTCDVTIAPTIAGTIPNAGLIAKFASQAAMGAATIRNGLNAGVVTTMFIAPLTLQFRNVAFNGGGGVCSALDPTSVSCPKCNAGSSTDCRPIEPCDFSLAEAANCVSIPVSIPVADALPVGP